MIYIDRNRLDGQGNPVKPDDDWFQISADARDTAEREGDTHVVREEVYSGDDIRASLEELFHRKCAYCETIIAGATWDVEHFRPKGRVAERADHPGYAAADLARFLQERFLSDSCAHAGAARFVRSDPDAFGV